MHSPFLSLLWQRKLLFALASFAVFAGITTAVFVWPKAYVATARVLLEAKPSEPLAGQPSIVPFNPSYMATQVDIAQSSRVAIRAIQILELDKSEVAKQRYEDERVGGETFAQFYSELLRKGLSVRPSRDSNVIDISYRTGDAKFAAQAANAFAKAYIATSLDLRLQPVREYAEWFEERVKTAKQTLKGAQKSHSDLQRRAGLTSADERLDVENARLQEISSQLLSAQAQLTEAEKRFKATRLNRGSESGADATGVPEVMSNPVVVQLRSDLARLEGKRAELLAKLGPRHPQMLELESETAAIQAKLSREIAVSNGTLDRQLDIAQGREATLRAAFAAQKERVLKLKRDRDDLAMLSKELEGSQRTHDLVAARLMQTTLESQAVNSGAIVLDDASEPTTPSSPRTTLGLSIAFLLAPIVGVISVLLQEALDRRIRNRIDIEEATSATVLCVVGMGRPSRSIALLRSMTSFLVPRKRSLNYS